MTVETIESIVIDGAAAAIIIWAWRCLPAGKIRWFFVTSFLFMAVYKIYDPDTDALSLLWIRHLAVYFGEICFYFFITTFSKRFIELEDADKKPRSVVLRQNTLILLPFISAATGVTWYQYVTEQGLPHILTLPIFVLVISLVRLRLTVYQSNYTAIVRLFTFGIGGWILIHVFEFLGESQQLFHPLLEDAMPHIEFFWYCVGVVLFWRALTAFKEIHHGG